MRLKKHGKFLLDFVTAYVEGNLERFDFDLDYSGYVMEHFPMFERETPKLAHRFAYTIDQAYDFGERLSDDSHREAIAYALDEFLTTGRVPDLI